MKQYDNASNGIANNTKNSPQQLEVIPLLQLLPKTREFRYFWENGLSKLIPRLTLKVHSDIETCYVLWNKFSPKKTLFDLWDFRYSWYEAFQYKPYFYTLYEGKRPLAVLPLWWDDSTEYEADEEACSKFKWFGSEWNENTTFFVESPKLLDLLLAVAPSPLHLNSITIEDTGKLSMFGKLSADEPRFIKNLLGVASIEELLSDFHKKDRYHLRADHNHIKELSPQVTHVTDADGMLEALEKSIDLVIRRFDGELRDKADFLDAKQQEAFRRIVINRGLYKMKFIVTKVQNYTAAIDMIADYNGCYYALRSANDLNRFKSIGNFMVYTEFEDALKGGFDLIDTCQYDYGWKHRFFDQVPVHLFKK